MHNSFNAHLRIIIGLKYFLNTICLNYSGELGIGIIRPLRNFRSKIGGKRFSIYGNGCGIPVSGLQLDIFCKGVCVLFLISGSNHEPEISRLRNNDQCPSFHISLKGDRTSLDGTPSSLNYRIFVSLYCCAPPNISDIDIGNITL